MHVRHELIQLWSGVWACKSERMDTVVRWSAWAVGVSEADAITRSKARLEHLMVEVGLEPLDAD